jgi:oligopeptide/dipeptide ABC transporter ATP-binding protein
MGAAMSRFDATDAPVPRAKIAGATAVARATPMLRIHGLHVHFPFGNRWFGRRGVVRAVDGVDLAVGAGEVVGVVGESGSGKTTLGRAVLRLVEATAGKVWLDGVDLGTLRGPALRAARRRIQIIFQDPYAALSPRMQVRQILAEPLRLHRLVARDDEDARVTELLGKVGLEPYMADRYAHEMSGGQRQRIAIARALAVEPRLIVADEPVSALDVSVRATILSILLRLQSEEGIALLFISHDLAVIEQVADRVAVMYRGRVVEEAAAASILSRPLHPYTQALLSAVPDPDPGRRTDRIRLHGEPTSGAPEGPGCPFAPRCREAQPQCRTVTPPLEVKASGWRVACLMR